MAKPKRALILAAGLGTRLRELEAAQNLAKPAVPLCGVPLVIYNAKHLQHLGVKELVINLCYKGDSVRAVFSRWSKALNLPQVKFIPEGPLGPLGSAGGVAFTREWLCKGLKDDESVLVCNGDSLFAGAGFANPIKNFYHKHCKAGAGVSLLACPKVTGRGLKVNKESIFEGLGYKSANRRVVHYLGVMAVQVGVLKRYFVPGVRDLFDVLSQVEQPAVKVHVEQGVSWLDTNGPRAFLQSSTQSKGTALAKRLQMHWLKKEPQ